MRTRSKEAGKKAQLVPDLPDDLWSKIVKIVGQKDWARASGTCKTFHRVQLRVIEVQSNRQDELLWLSKRWSTAEALVIHPSSLTSRKASADASLLKEMSAAGAHWPHNLRHLYVYVPRDLAGRKETPPAKWVKQIINNAHKLEVLVLNLVRPVPLAANSMAALKHLAISAVASALPAKWSCIESLRCLETLHLGVCAHNRWPDDFSTQTSTLTSAIRLLGCNNLHALHMKNLVPTDFAVPAGCRVTFESRWLPDEDGIGSGLRQGVMALLRACTVFSSACQTESQLRYIESALGQPLFKLEEVELLCAIEANAHEPFAFEIGGAMPRLTRIHIANFGPPINVNLSSRIYLRSLSLEGYLGTTVGFTPVHEASMFRDIEKVGILWSGGQPELIRIMAPFLEARCIETGDAWTLGQPTGDLQGIAAYMPGTFRWLLGGDREVNKWQATNLEDIDPSESLHWYNRDSLLSCGACEGCLQHLGVLQMYSSVPSVINRMGGVTYPQQNLCKYALLALAHP